MLTEMTDLKDTDFAIAFGITQPFNLS